MISQFDCLLVFMNLGNRIEEVTFCEKMLNPNCRESSLNHIIVMCVRKCLILQKKRGVVVAGNNLFKVSFYVRSA